MRNLSVLIIVLLVNCFAIKNSNEIINFQNVKKDTNTVKLFLEIGNNLVYNHPDSALFVFNKALSISEELELNEFISECLNSIGICYYYHGIYNKAIDYYIKSLSMYENLGNRKGMADMYNNLANIYDIQGKYEPAMEYYLKSLEIDEEFNNETGIAICYNNIGVLYISQEIFDKAIDYIMKALVLNEKLNDSIGIADCFNNLGLIYTNQKSYDMASESLLKSLEIMKKIENKNGISVAYLNLAELKIIEKKYHTSIEYAERGLNLAKETGFLNLQNKSYEILTLANDSLKYYQRAYENSKYFKTTGDSLNERNTSKQISDIQIKYGIKEKEKERVLQQKLYDKQKFYLNVTLILIFGMIIAIVFILKSNSKKRDTNKKLVKAMNSIKTLKGLLPICSSCKKIRGDSGYWTQVEDYLSSHSDAKFSHSVCPECVRKLYPDHKNKS
ncbi:MAG: tetratricopeptide repeat protein [Candidatus Delongbacteria bacterium]|jgi:two-component system sensor histidine kinase/response regulator|nr:tetratricopeptide repeat protein [Candidatus Delongbacteria bacterium]